MSYLRRISAVAGSAALTLAVAASASVARPLAGEWKGDYRDGTPVSFHVVHDDAFGVSHTLVQDIRFGGHQAFEGAFVNSNTTSRVSHAGGAVATAAIAHREFTFNINWGGFLRTAGQHRNLCEELGIEPGGEARIKVKASREVVTPPEHGSVRDATLVCSPMLDIWGHTAGPWDPNGPGGPGWLSVRCPRSEQPMTNGAGYSTDPHPHVTQVDGGFGHNHDGYWHYRFHNWSGQTVRIQFWGVCSEYDQTGGVNGG